MPVKQEKYEPYYLKITPGESKDKLGNYIFNLLTCEHYPFGLFGMERMLIRGKKGLDLAIVSFDPYSRDQHSSFKITRQTALRRAIKHIESFGFNAKAFDLEGIVDKIK